MKGKNILKNITSEGLPIAAGVIASNFIQNQAANLPYIKDYPKLHGLLPVVIGAVLSDQKGMVGKVGVGMLAGGIANTAGAFVPALNGYSDSQLNAVLNDVLNGADEAAAEFVEQNINEGGVFGAEDELISEGEFENEMG